MTKKDFEFIAHILNRILDSSKNLPTIYELDVKNVIFIADMIAIKYPRFDKTKFLIACGLDK